MIFHLTRSSVLKVTLLLLVTLLSRISPAQVAVGAGFSNVRVGLSAFDEADGVVITVKKDFGQKRLQFTPMASAGIFFSEVNRQVAAFHASTITLSPSVSYTLFKIKKLEVKPFIGPQASWLTSIRSEDVLFDRRFMRAWRTGLNVGLNLQIHLSEAYSLELIPIQLLFGDEDFRQAQFQLLLKFK